MRRKQVDSTTIASIGYTPQDCELDIEFRATQDVYRYFGVPAQEHAEFMAAESKGYYLNHVFKPKGHPFLVLKKRGGASPSASHRRCRTA